VPIQDLGLSHGGLAMIGVFSVALACAWLAVYYVSDLQQARTNATIVAAIIAVALVCAVFARPIEHTIDVASLGIQGSQLSSIAWALDQSALTAANDTAHYNVYSFLVRLPLWFALLVVMMYTSRATRRPHSGAEDGSRSRAVQATYA